MIAVLLHRFYIKNQYYCYPKFLVEYYTQCSLSIYFCYSPTIYFFIQTETKKIFFFSWPKLLLQLFNFTEPSAKIGTN